MKTRHRMRVFNYHAQIVSFKVYLAAVPIDECASLLYTFARSWSCHNIFKCAAIQWGIYLIFGLGSRLMSEPRVC